MPMQGQCIFVRLIRQLKFSIMITDSLNIALGGTTGKEIPFPPISLVDENTGEPNYHNVSTLCCDIPVIP